MFLVARETPENKEFINQHLFDHNIVSLLLYSRCLLLVENQFIFLSGGMLLGICGCNTESPQVGFSVSPINIYFQ